MNNYRKKLLEKGFAASYYNFENMQALPIKLQVFIFEMKYPSYSVAKYEMLNPADNKSKCASSNRHIRFTWCNLLFMNGMQTFNLNECM